MAERSRSRPTANGPIATKKGAGFGHIQPTQHLGRFERSCAMFDAGIRIALHARVLIHKSRSSVPLLAHLQEDRSILIGHGTRRRLAIQEAGCQPSSTSAPV
jgi:hypothetical protein